MITPPDSALHVNKGIDAPETVNPNFVRKSRVLQTVEYYTNGILLGDRTILSQAFTIIESTKPEHQNLAQQIIADCLPHSGKSFRVGITGVPGAGKSTFIETLGMFLIETFGKKIAVLAIDPSGSTSGGSILGDKTRMEKLGTHANAFIRPTPSGGTLGGTARKTAEGIILCEAAGFETIFVETVGVGQSEIAVKSMTDFFLMLQIAGAGDELQGLKRGITEAADAIAINKADGNNITAAARTRMEFENALHLFPRRTHSPEPKVFTLSAYTGVGISDLWNFIQHFESEIKVNGFFEQNRHNQAVSRMHDTLIEALKNRFYQNISLKNKISELENDVKNSKLSPYEAAQMLLNYEL